MKRRIIALATVTVLTLALSACGATEESNSSTPTVEQSSQTVTVEPTEAPTQAPTEAPVKPTVAPTEAPEVTVEPTEVPTETPEEPVGNPSDVAEDPNFAVIRDMAYGWLDNYYEVERFYEYNEFESIIETMDKSRYEVTAVEGLDPVLRAGLTDAEKEDNIKRFLELYICTAGKVDGTYYSALTPTGELYTMTLTDLVTGETIVWGFRVHAENSFKPGNYVVQEFTTLSLMDMYTGSIDIDNSYIEKIKFIFGL